MSNIILQYINIKRGDFNNNINHRNINNIDWNSISNDLYNGIPIKEICKRYKISSKTIIKYKHLIKKDSSSSTVFFGGATGGRTPDYGMQIHRFPNYTIAPFFAVILFVPH